MSKVVKLSDIKASPLRRNSTWFEELDWMYGYSIFSDRTEWGMPKGKISLWSGTSGVGKSRLCIEVAKRFSKNYTNGVVLYFQTESELEDFASWVKDTAEYDKIHCSGENRIDEIIKIIYEIKPKLIFIDSVNEIEEFENGTKGEARRLIQGSNGRVGLKKAIHDVGAHLILLGQLNQDGKTIKGGTSLPHLVDIALDIVPTNIESGSEFIAKIGIKHRYGKKNTETVFMHTDTGVINIYEGRLSDPFWRQTHGIPDPQPTQPLPQPEPAQLQPGSRYIGDNGEWTNIITPQMQIRMDKSPTYTTTLGEIKPIGWYDKIGKFISDRFNR